MFSKARIFEGLIGGIHRCPAETRDLKEQVAGFLHDKSHEVKLLYPVRPWPLGTLTL